MSATAAESHEDERPSMTVRDALATVADWLAGGDSTSGWGGTFGPRPDSDFGDVAIGTADQALPPNPALAEARALTDLKSDVEACRKCRLGEGRRNAAFGEGVDRPLVLVIGEGPGAEEDAQGRPFVGPAGRLLDKMLASVGLSRDTNCYIANIVKCRPPGNREPAPDERAACMPWLETQIASLRPAVILAMGRTAACTLLRSEEGIGRLRGRWFERGGIPLLATYHPSALLRDESLKRPAWEDLKTLKFRLSEFTDRDETGGGHPEDSAPASGTPD